ncbi:MAG: PspC domain-containing protein [Bacteroidales bacterium]|nr:PspC domain-containing protein [Bacteroidales bacterium]
MKKLVLDRQNRKIAGVCSGIAKYLDVDVTVVRVIFLIALIWGGFGLWAYLIIWAVAPQE